MCGVWGWQFIQGDRRLQLLAAALMVQMDRRGGHAWGYYADGHLFKGLGLFSAGVPARSLRNAQTLIAHCRLASVGNKDKVANAHPFEIGDVIGAHNGSIHNHDDLNKEYNRNFEVDSMQIFAHLNEGRPLEELAGYGSITYLRKSRPERVCLCSFNNGDLAIAKITVKKKEIGSAWASTHEALGLALSAAGFDWTSIKVDDDKQYYIENGIPYIDPAGKVKIQWSRFKSTYDSSKKTVRPWENDGKQKGIVGVEVYSPGRSYTDKTAEYFANEAKIMDDLYNEHPELFEGLTKDSTFWVDPFTKTLYLLVRECCLCNKVRATTYLSKSNIRICHVCERAMHELIQEEEGKGKIIEEGNIGKGYGSCAM